MKTLLRTTFAICLTACSGGSEPSAAPTSGPPSSDGGVITVVTDSGVRSPEAATRVEAEGPCEMLGVTGLPIIDAAGLPLSRIVRIGKRWAGGGEDVGGFLTFGTDGKAASSLVSLGSFDFAAGGDTLHVFSASHEELAWQEFDEAGSPKSSKRAMARVNAVAPPRVSVAVGESGGIAVWLETADLRGVTFDAAGATTSTFEIPGPARDVATAAVGSRFVVVWSGQHDGGPALMRAFASTVGLDGSPSALIATRAPRSVLRVARTDGGFVVLVAGAYQAEIIAVDEAGTFRPPVVQYDGLRAAWDLATQGNRLLLAATRSDRRAAVRLLQSDGTPAGQWHCLTGPTAPVDPMAIAPSAPGWTVTHATADGSLLLRTLDASGY